MSGVAEEPAVAVSRRPHRGWWLVAVLVVVVLAAGVTALGALRGSDDTAPARGDLAAQPTDVAVTAARDFFTLDHRTLEDDLARVAAQATGEFAAQYARQREELARSVREGRLVITADVPESGVAVEHATADEVWVLVAVDVHTEPEGTDSRYRTRVVLVPAPEGAAGWRVARLEQVG
ncbi:hypothetical protein [Nocardioides sp.]|uniref:hypothetical protein n=1 Tax=Nocardioides sp. TaxID=35761 RepID=UPI00351951B6